MLKCKCDCGNVSLYFKTNILSYKSTKCKYCQNLPNLENKRIGKITLISRKEKDLNARGAKYECRCDCGNIFTRHWINIRNRTWDFCPKCRPRATKPIYTKEEVIQKLIEGNKQKHFRTRKKIVGKKFGRLKIVGFSHWFNTCKRKRAIYKVKCKCGVEKLIRTDHLKFIQSCGCLRKENMRRGETSPRAVLTNQEAKVIRELYSSGMGYRLLDLANMFNTTETLISRVINNKSYKD